MKRTYLIELEVDEKWYQAISTLTADVYDGEICEWISVKSDTYDEDLTNDDENETIKETPNKETK